MKINQINNVSFGKLYINKTDENRFNLRVFTHDDLILAQLYDTCVKIDSKTEDTPVTLNLFNASIPAKGGKTKKGWHFVISDRNTGETLSESMTEKSKDGILYNKALEKLVKNLKADKFNWAVNHTTDDLIDKFN